MDKIELKIKQAFESEIEKALEQHVQTTKAIEISHKWFAITNGHEFYLIPEHHPVGIGWRVLFSAKYDPDLPILSDDKGKNPIVKCGEKGRHLQIPEGYRKMGDDEVVTIECRVANVFKVQWERVENDEIGMKAYVVGDHVITPIK